MAKNKIVGGGQGQVYRQIVPPYYISNANPPIRSRGKYVQDSYSAAPVEERMAVRLPNGLWAMAQRSYQENDLPTGDSRDVGVVGPEASAPNAGDQPPYFGETPAPLPGPLPWE